MANHVHDFEEIMDGVDLEAEGMAILRELLKNDYREEHLDAEDSDQVDRVIDWTLDNLRDFYAGDFDLFVNVAQMQAGVLQPKMPPEPGSPPWPVTVGLESARNALEHIEELEKRITSALRRRAD